MTRQQKLDAFAKRKGYPSYFAYRNAQAKAEGYSSYADLRRSRRAATERLRIPSSPGGASRTVSRAAGVVGGYSPALDMTRDIRMAYREAARNTTDIALQAARIGENRKRTSSTKDSLVRPAVGILDDLDGRVRDFYTGEFPKIYAAGARAANPHWRMGPGDQARISDLTKEGAARLVGNNRAAKRSAIKTIPELVDMDTKRGFLRAKDRPIKGTRFANGREPGFSQHAEMILRSNGARAYNLGFLHAASGGDEDKLFMVSDGSDCGWSQHDDPEKANGKIVTFNEALSRPIAHPNCVRTFSIAPPGAKPTKGIFRKVAGKAGEILIESAKATARAEATSLAMHIATDAKVREAARKVLQTSKANFIQYRQNLDMVARLYEHARKTRIAAMGNVTDLTTFLPAKVSAKDVADDVAAWIEDFADGAEVPEHVLRVIGVPVRAGRKAVGDQLDDWNVFYNASYRMDRGIGRIPMQTKVIGGRGQRAAVRRAPAGPMDILKKAASDQFFEWLGPKIPQAKFARLTFPNINRSINPLDRPRRLTVDLGNLAKVTRTSIKNRGVINHLSLNPNGLLRLSLSKDPETGFITPTFRAIPPGPLHIMTKVNRGKAGNITSLSSEVRLITRPIPGVESLTGRLNLNLRKLGLDSLADIKNLTREDFLKFSAEDLRGVSIAANLRARGFNIFDISRTFRLPWEETEKLWNLSNHYLDDFLADLKAESARAKFIAIEGGVGDVPLAGEQAESMLSRNLGLVRDKDLTLDQQRALNAYQGNSDLLPDSEEFHVVGEEYYKEINGMLRGTLDIDPEDTVFPATVRELDAMMTPIPQSITVDRVVSRAALESSSTDISTGMVFRDRGYLSTSVNVPEDDLMELLEADVKMEIEVPPGIKGIYIGGLDKELLLERGLSFKVIDWNETERVLRLRAVPPITPRPILRIVDPIKGDPLGPGGVPSDVPRVKVPSKLHTTAARRAYIEARLPNFERERVAQLRLAGDFSTVKHLRERDELTWEEIAVRMRMTVSKVKSIYNHGVTGKL